jgi:hypothetical protein
VLKRNYFGAVRSGMRLFVSHVKASFLCRLARFLRVMRRVQCGFWPRLARVCKTIHPYQFHLTDQSRGWQTPYRIVPPCGDVVPPAEFVPSVVGETAFQIVLLGPLGPSFDPNIRLGRPQLLRTSSRAHLLRKRCLIHSTLRFGGTPKHAAGMVTGSWLCFDRLSPAWPGWKLVAQDSART